MEKEVKALLLDSHRSIEEAASYAIEEIKKGQITIMYPSHVRLTSEEQKALLKHKNDQTLLMALKKIIVDAASYPVFHLFELMDGVTDPQNYDEYWSGAKFISRSEEDEEDFDLHDEFFATYDEWKNQSHP